MAVVDFAKLEQQTRTAYDLTVALADTASPPAFMSPNPALATFADAVTLDEILTAGAGDVGLFSPADQTRLLQIQAEIHGFVTAGEPNFDSNDILTMLLDTADVIGPNGARARISGGSGVTYYWPTGGLRVDGDIQMAGGGLHNGKVSLRQVKREGRFARNKRPRS